MGLSPQARKLRARLGAYAQHAKHDTRKTTAAARLAFRESFADKVRVEHPELDEDEIERRADAARRTWYAGLSLRSATIRGRRNARKAPLNRPDPGRHSKPPDVVPAEDGDHDELEAGRMARAEAAQ